MRRFKMDNYQEDFYYSDFHYLDEERCTCGGKLVVREVQNGQDDNDKQEQCEDCGMIWS